MIMFQNFNFDSLNDLDLLRIDLVKVYAQASQCFIFPKTYNLIFKQLNNVCLKIFLQKCTARFHNIFEVFCKFNAHQVQVAAQTIVFDRAEAKVSSALVDECIVDSVQAVNEEKSSDEPGVLYANGQWSSWFHPFDALKLVQVTPE